MTAAITAYAAIGLGSNMGDRQAMLDQALALIDRLARTRVVATARVYHSEGWGRENLKPFLNTALAVETELGPRALLDGLLDAENCLGRQRDLKWGPRVIDLDLLAYGDEQVAEPGLAVPHPYIAHRPFVYRPLGELIDLHPAWAKLAVPSEEGRAIEKDTWPLHPSAGSPWGADLQNYDEPQNHNGVEEAAFHSPSEEGTQAFARRLAAFLRAGDLIALNAPMGSGKSVVARGIARGLGIEGPIQSPTFTLCRSYNAGRVPFEHWDFYRLGSEDDLESTGFFTPESRRAVRAIEWAEQFPAALERPLLEISLRQTSPATRRIELRSPALGRVPFWASALAAHPPEAPAQEEAG